MVDALNKNLSNFDGNRKNNFTLVRVFLSWLVLFSHSFAIQNPTGLAYPFASVLKGSTDFGTLAVSGFFVISGFLVTASLQKRGWFEYVISRSIRVFPALFVCVFISVFVLAPVVTSLSISDYFFNSDFYLYLNNIVPLWSVEFILPGVFDSNTRNAVNGSLWSLIVELRCYILLAIAGMFGFLSNRVLANFSILWIFVFALNFSNSFPMLGASKDHVYLITSLYFLVGVSFYINRQFIPISKSMALFSLLAIFYSFGEQWFLLVFPVCFAYLLFFVVYATLFIDIDKKIGDISYGMYIYAWPIQQTVAFAFPGLNVYENIVWSTLLTIVCAKISWEYIEKPALSLKERFSQVNVKYLLKRV